MVSFLKSKIHKYEPILMVEYLPKSEKYLTHLVGHLSGEHYPNNSIDKSINLVMPGYQLIAKVPELVSHPLFDNHTQYTQP